MSLTRVRTATLTTSSRADALAALMEACRPYGSLSAEVPALMLDWACGTARAGWSGALDCDDPHRIDVAHRLLAAIRDADTSECSDLTLGDFVAAVRTPTSGTAICIRRFAGGVDITVDFGPRGSEYRGSVLLASAQAWRVERIDTALADEAVRS